MECRNQFAQEKAALEQKSAQEKAAVEAKCSQITDKVSALDLKLTEAYLSCTIGAVVIEKMMDFGEMLTLANDELEKARKEKQSWSIRVLDAD